jgi:hypothetical protein
VLRTGDLLVRGNPDGRTRAAEKDPLASSAVRVAGPLLAADRGKIRGVMRMYRPNSAHLGNLETSVRRMDLSDPTSLQVRLHDRWVSIHPFVLSLVAAAALAVRGNGGRALNHPTSHRFGTSHG